MFTGIIKGLGTVNSISRGRKSGILSIKSASMENNAYPGQSIAINGICLTVRKINQSGLVFDFSPETFNSTTMKYLKPADKVNMEPALSVTSDLSGHFVLGHVDGVGRIKVKIKSGNSYILGIEILESGPESVRNYIIEKGSISADGISLTITDIDNSVFYVSIIPHTYDETNIKFKKIGDYVNLESDILEKTVILKINDVLSSRLKGITNEFLAEKGFL